MNSDVSDGLGGDLLVCGGRSRGCCNRLRGGGDGARRRGNMRQLLVIGWHTVVDSLND